MCIYIYINIYIYIYINMRTISIDSTLCSGSLGRLPLGLAFNSICQIRAVLTEQARGVSRLAVGRPRYNGAGYGLRQPTPALCCARVVMQVVEVQTACLSLQLRLLWLTPFPSPSLHFPAISAELNMDSDSPVPLTQHKYRPKPKHHRSTRNTKKTAGRPVLSRPYVR